MTIKTKLDHARTFVGAAALFVLLACAASSTIARSPQQPATAQDGGQQRSNTNTQQDAPPKKKGFFRHLHERVQTEAAEDERRAQERRASARSPAAAGTRSDERSPVAGGVRMKQIPATSGQCRVEEDRFKERRSVDLAVGRVAEFDANGRARGGIGELRLAFGIDIREGQDPNTATPPRTGSAAIADAYLEAQGKRAAGRPPAQPKVIISLQFLGSRPTLLDDNDLLAIIDGGRPVDVGRVLNYGRISFRDSHEDYQVWASMDTFRRLAVGKQIEIKIKDLEFALPVQAITEMRRFAECSGIRLE